SDRAEGEERDELHSSEARALSPEQARHSERKVDEEEKRCSTSYVPRLDRVVDEDRIEDEEGGGQEHRSLFEPRRMVHLLSLLRVHRATSTFRLAARAQYEQ